MSPNKSYKYLNVDQCYFICQSNGIYSTAVYPKMRMLTITSRPLIWFKWYYNCEATTLQVQPKENNNLRLSSIKLKLSHYMTPEAWCGWAIFKTLELTNLLNIIIIIVKMSVLIWCNMMYPAINLAYSFIKAV